MVRRFVAWLAVLPALGLMADGEGDFDGAVRLGAPEVIKSGWNTRRFCPADFDRDGLPWT